MSSEPSSEVVTVECVAERGGPVTLIRVEATGAQPWLEVPVRAVAAYQYAVVAVTVLVVVLAAVALRPIDAGWPWWKLAVLDLIVTITAWLLVARVAEHALARVTETVAADTANALLNLIPPESTVTEPERRESP